MLPFKGVDQMLKIAIGADHRGVDHKQTIQKGVSDELQRIEWIDVGTHTKERVDYPIFAHDVALLIQSKKAHLGILLCGSGNGMVIAANRFKNIYAALAWNEITAARAREEDNANILSLPTDFVNPEEAVQLTIVWLNAQFLGDRYEKRIKMIDTWGGL